MVLSPFPEALKLIHFIAISLSVPPHNMFQVLNAWYSKAYRSMAKTLMSMLTNLFNYHKSKLSRKKFYLFMLDGRSSSCEHFTNMDIR